jgi:hypothetical protein
VGDPVRATATPQPALVTVVYDFVRDLPAASADTHRMAETGTGSGRSLSGAVPNGQTPTPSVHTPTQDNAHDK